MTETIATTPGLTCSANTLRFADLPTRAAAAAAAGFSGLGLRVSDLRGLDDARVHELFAEHRLRTLELEHTWDWAADGADEVEAVMFGFADRIGVRQINVPMFYAHPLDELVRPFRGLCDRAADHGVLIGFEFLPYAHVRSLGQAWQVVAAAERPNGGVVVDLWHWRRSGATIADLAAIPPERITSVQLCETRPDPLPDSAQEARHHRELPGHGVGSDGRTAALLKDFVAHGISCPVSVEVFSDALDALPAAEAATLAAHAGTSVLAAAGWPHPHWTVSTEVRRIHAGQQLQ